MIRPVPIGRVAILAPMRSEFRPLMRPLSLRPPVAADGLWSGSLGRIEIVAAMTGVGMRRAALAAEGVLDSPAIDLVVVVGVAGGIGPSVQVGDLVVPEVVLDRGSGAAYHPRTLGGYAPRGILATSDELIVDPQQAADLGRRGIIAVDMETAAIAAVCEARGCPWSVFRAISDRADDGSTDAAIFGLAGANGEPNVPAVARLLLTRPRRIPQLARLARGLALATHAAADAAVSALQAMAIAAPEG